MNRPQTAASAPSFKRATSSSSSSSQTRRSRTGVTPPSVSPTNASPTATPPLSFLLRLPPVLFVPIAQLLTIREKLAHFTHIHRSLPRLTPAAFRHSTLQLNAHNKSATLWLRPLLSSVSSLSYDWDQVKVDKEGKWHHVPVPMLGYSSFLQSLAPRSPSASSFFSNLRHLELLLPSKVRDDNGGNNNEPDDAYETVMDQLSALLSSPNAFPLLTGFHFDGRRSDFAKFRSVLPCLSALRQVALHAWTMSVVDLFALLRLPGLDVVEVHATVCHVQGSAACDCQGEITLSSGCRTLRLSLSEHTATGHQHSPTTRHRRVVPLLFDHLATLSACPAVEERSVSRQTPQSRIQGKVCRPESDCAGATLLRLSLILKRRTPPHEAAELTSIASLGSLRALDLLTHSESKAMAAFAVAASPFRLPHLRALRCCIDTYSGTLTAAHTVTAQAIVRCICMFASQLHVLDVPVLDGDTTSEALAALLHCSQLRRLTLSAGFLTTRAQSSRRPQTTSFHPPVDGLPLLPHLHTLALNDITISDEQLVRLLRHCPALEDVHLEGPQVSLAVLVGAAQLPRLRRLRLKSDSDWLYNPLAVGQSLQLLEAAMWAETRPFSHLRVLRVYRRSHEPDGKAQPSQQLLTLLPTVFRHAPLAHLHLGLPYKAADLHLFAGFNQLRLLSLPSNEELLAVRKAARLPELPRKRPFFHPLHVGG